METPLTRRADSTGQGVTSLPTRDGNFAFDPFSTTRTPGYEPTYEGWKLGLRAGCRMNPVGLRAYLRGMETMGLPHRRVRARGYEPTYEGWKHLRQADYLDNLVQLRAYLRGMETRSAGSRPATLTTLRAYIRGMETGCGGQSV